MSALSHRINSLIGFSFLLLGAIGLFILYAVRIEGTFLGFERWINPAPVLWGVGSLAAAAFGVSISWNTAHSRTSWRPTVSGRRFNSVNLYTRPGCHLCADAHAILTQYRMWLPTVVEINIDEDPDLQVKYNTCVPVLECDGKVRFHGQVSETLLQRLLEGTEPV